MRQHVMEGVCLAIGLLTASPSAAGTDAVLRWNENAGKAAAAACLTPEGNPLAESRMYAMVHIAVHDALNAIDRRSRPYALRCPGEGWNVIQRRHRGRGAGCAGRGHRPAPGIAVSASSAASPPSRPIMRRPSASFPTTSRRPAGSPSGRRRPRPSSRCAPTTDRTHRFGLRLSAGDPARRYRFHSGHALRVRATLGRGDAVRAPRVVAVPRRPAVPDREQRICGGLQRGEVARR